MDVQDFRGKIKWNARRTDFGNTYKYDKRNAHHPVRHRSPMRSIIRVMSALCFASLSWAAQCWFGRRGALAWSKSH